jgi:hypothetical protein
MFKHLLINVLDQSTCDDSVVQKRVLQEFIENLQSRTKNILRTFRMKSYSGMESSSFSSDHVAWRETLYDPFCDEDDSTKLSLLRWTEASTVNSVRFWRVVPAGFGAFFDIRSGRQWVIIASPDRRDVDVEVDRFTRWDRYLQDFSYESPDFNIETPLEAIRLEPGNRL